MKHKVFKSIDEFLKFFGIKKNYEYTIEDGNTAYFEFQPYKNDKTTIRGWIESFDSDDIYVSFKYREFELGSTIWNIETARKRIKSIDYYYYGKE